MCDLSFVIWYSLDSCKYKPEVCNGCHDISVMVNELENIAILNIKGIDRCVFWYMSRSDVISRLNNSKLDDKGSLWIWTFVQIKH